MSRKLERSGLPFYTHYYLNGRLDNEWLERIDFYRVETGVIAEPPTNLDIRSSPAILQFLETEGEVRGVS
jgi:hypothetical protein